MPAEPCCEGCSPVGPLRLPATLLHRYIAPDKMPASARPVRAAARALGAPRVLAIDSLPERLALAQQLGAEAINRNSCNPLEAVRCVAQANNVHLCLWRTLLAVVMVIVRGGRCGCKRCGGSLPNGHVPASAAGWSPQAQRSAVQCSCTCLPRQIGLLLRSLLAPLFYEATLPESPS